MSYMDEIQRQVDEIKHKTAERSRRQNNYLHQVLDTPAGRAVLADIIQMSGVLSDADTSFAAGRRSIGIYLCNAIMRIDQNLFLTMQREFFNRETEK